MPPDMESQKKEKKEISMRHSKLKASEAAMLMGELQKPSWQSRNEGIHERVSFEDTIWGFDLAGGSFYKTPLRVTAVKPDSRADKAGIRPGDTLLRINDIDTSTLTIQEAHEIIVESGIYLRIAVTAPEDLEDSYNCWQDPLEEEGYDSEEERRKEAERNRKRIVHAKVSSYWSLQWPWVSKRRVIYRESNCFMVPSKYESHHRDKFPEETKFGPKVLDDIVLHNKNSDPAANKLEQLNGAVETNNIEEKLNEDKKGDDNSNNIEAIANGVDGIQAEKAMLEDSEEIDESLIETSADNEESSMQNNVIENGQNNIQQNNYASEDEEVSTMEEDEQSEEVFDKSDNQNEEQEKSLNDILNESDVHTDSETIDENER